MMSHVVELFFPSGRIRPGSMCRLQMSPKLHHCARALEVPSAPALANCRFVRTRFLSKSNCAAGTAVRASLRRSNNNVQARLSRFSICAGKLCAHSQFQRVRVGLMRSMSGSSKSCEHGPRLCLPVASCKLKRATAASFKNDGRGPSAAVRAKFRIGLRRVLWRQSLA